MKGSDAPKSRVRALTIRQPWASLIARGYKTVEIRTWETQYRGPLLIHAGRAVDWTTETRLVGPDSKHVASMMSQARRTAPRGVAVCLASLVQIRRGRAADAHLAAGIDARGKWAWILDDIRRIPPIPLVGKQGLWWAEIPTHVLTPDTPDPQELDHDPFAELADALRRGD